MKNMLLCTLLFTSAVFAHKPNPHKILLPESFKVYVNGPMILNHPAPGFSEKLLPTNNDFKDVPGCYVACYSHQKLGAIYEPSYEIYLMGQIRVSGIYNHRICTPRDIIDHDISVLSTYTQLCADKINVCKAGQCWAGGDTGGWFGLNN